MEVTELEKMRQTDPIGARRSSVVLELPNERAGVSLIDHLARLHAELSPIDDERCCVRVEPAAPTLEALIDIFRRVRRWQTCAGVRILRAHVGRHVYTLSAR
jgi:hypothetical protein